ncbi:hypothetical protein PoB_004526500 [Plakobranchus ocellatus]|uniref:Uncharacterized protein n=1 Tax=Plakobranchus ocellatus TaxID=259542 RepID=A0AAV4BDX5_9GAST|nr:hypothetical protein PoB_004526500 [Plakobranchus ocellatus]
MFISLAGPSFRPLYVDITDDGCLVCSTHVLVRFEGMIIPAALDVIARVQVDTGAILFEKSVPQIQCPHGIAIASDGSILVTDRKNKTLHLVSSQGAWTKQLWSVPSGADQDKELKTVTTDGSVCVCVTMYGSVYILDCVY